MRKLALTVLLLLRRVISILIYLGFGFLYQSEMYADLPVRVLFNGNSPISVYAHIFLWPFLLVWFLLTHVFIWFVGAGIIILLVVLLWESYQDRY